MFNYNNAQVNASGIGVSSSPILVNDAIKGESYYRTLTVHNFNNNGTIVLLSSTGEIKDWILFNDYNDNSIQFNEITIPGKDSKQVLVNITIPERIANDKYNGTIIVTEKNKDEDISNGNTSIVTFSYPIKIYVEVTDEQNLNLTIDSVYIDDNEVNYPIITYIRVINKGNVIARPKIYETITKNKILAAELTDTNEKIQPGVSKLYELRWNTTGMVPGGYLANINIFLQNQEILSQNITFNVLKVGELKRDGYLSNVTVYGDLSTGKDITIYGKFTNSGLIELTANFVIKVFNDDMLIDTIETAEKQTSKGKEHTFIIEYQFPKNGTYLLENYVIYNDVIGYKQTNSSFIELSVGSDYSISPLFFAILGIIAICIVCGMIFYLKRKDTNITHKKISTTKKFKIKNSASAVSNKKNNGKKIKKIPLRRKKPNYKKTKSIEPRLSRIQLRRKTPAPNKISNKSVITNIRIRQKSPTSEKTTNKRYFIPRIRIRRKTPSNSNKTINNKREFSQPSVSQNNISDKNTKQNLKK